MFALSSGKWTKKALIGILLLAIIAIWLFFFTRNNSNDSSVGNFVSNLLTGKKDDTTEVLWLTKTKDREYIWKYIGTELVDNEKIFWITDSGSQNKGNASGISEEERISNEVKPYIKTVCMSFTKLSDVLQSTTFGLIKDKIDKIKKVAKDKDNFSYVILPKLVSSSCFNSDTTLKDGLVRYLQSDFGDVIVADNKNMQNYKKHIDAIAFNSLENISLERIKSDKKYFNEVFFENNLAGIADVYFSEYIFLKDKTDKDFFKYFSVISLDERNEILERTARKLTAFLNTVGIKDVAEFRKMILKNYWYGNDLGSMKKVLIEKYKIFDKKLKEKDINLTLELLDIDNLYKFYTGENFKTIRNNPELYSLFQEIGLWHLHYSIVSDKFADSLNEWWSGKEQFWDSIIGNGIIRIGFMYLRDTEKSWNK